ncbi:MAG: type II secretion system protein [Akkermansiaceae bacterium]|nr:type II secretion system protein [Akkermansiaceae bacterium]NNM29494.1 type II secretion system protein [Akkermansiaceae bacterium]
MTTARAPRRGGFTLVEVLAVIAIIAVLLSVAAMGIQRIDRGQATTSALAIAEAVFEEARGVAISRGTAARVVINNNAEDRERYRTFMFVSAQDETGKWEVVSRGTKMPGGVYFDPALSEAGSQLVENLGSWGNEPMVMPGRSRQAVDAYYYEFNSEGICLDAAKSDPKPGAAFVVIGGILPSGQTEPILQGNNKEGFIIWRNGRTSLFRSPGQIGVATE